MATYLDPGFEEGTYRITLPVPARPVTLARISGAAVSGVLSVSDLVDLYDEIGAVLDTEAPTPPAGRHSADVATYHAAMQRLQAVRMSAGYSR